MVFIYSTNMKGDSECIYIVDFQNHKYSYF